jgi:O-antigen/teichoic acid export membrane protein
VTTDSALLFANTLTGAILGVLFWTLAARLYDISAIGLTSAIAAAAALIAIGSNLGVSPIVIRYLPVSGAHEWQLCVIASLIPASLALVIAVALSALPTGQTLIADLNAHGPIATLVPMTLAVGTAVMLVQDSIFIARHQAALVLIRGVGAIVVRFALLVPLAKLGAFGLVSGFAAGALASVALGATAWGRHFRHQEERPVSLRQMALYGGTNYLSGLFSQLPQMLYPPLIAIQVSHAAAGAFTFAWMAAALLMALPPSVANVLLTRLVHNPDEAPRYVRSVTKAIVAVIVLLAGMVYAFAVLFGWMLFPKAASDVQAFLPLLLGSVVAYAIVRLQSMALALRGSLHKLLILNGMVALTAVSLPFALVSRFGVQGIEVGWFLSQLVGVIVAQVFQGNYRSGVGGV